MGLQHVFQKRVMTRLSCCCLEGHQMFKVLAKFRTFRLVTEPTSQQHNSKGSTPYPVNEVYRLGSAVIFSQLAECLGSSSLTHVARAAQKTQIRCEPQERPGSYLPYLPYLLSMPVQFARHSAVAAFDAAATFYCPISRWHYQLRRRLWWICDISVFWILKNRRDSHIVVIPEGSTRRVLGVLPRHPLFPATALSLELAGISVQADLRSTSAISIQRERERAHIPAIPSFWVSLDIHCFSKDTSSNIHPHPTKALLWKVHGVLRG